MKELGDGSFCVGVGVEIGDEVDGVGLVGHGVEGTGGSAADAFVVRVVTKV